MSNRYSDIFSIFRRIFLKIHHMNNCGSFLYILTKLDPQIVESRQDTAKSFDSNTLRMVSAIYHTSKKSYGNWQIS